MREKGWGMPPAGKSGFYAGRIRSDLWRTGDHVFLGGMCVWYECVYANAAPIPGSVRRSVAVMGGQTGWGWKSPPVRPVEPVPELFWWWS